MKSASGLAGAVFVVVAGACSSSRTEDAAPLAADAGADAVADGAAEPPPFPTLPYPAGPYGTGIGDVFPDFTIVGYRMSRARRDSTKLPFEDLRLGEIRSDPSCTCIAVIFNAAGTACGPCVQEDATFSSALLKDAGLCAIEILDFNYDTFDPASADNNQPPTRADLDTFTQGGRETFPVGLMTDATRRTLATPSIPVIPDAFVVRPNDMRVVGFFGGVGANLGESVRQVCSTPRAAPEVVVTGVDARKIAVRLGDVFFGDGSGAVMHVPATGGPATRVATTSGIPEALVLDGANVYWATRGAGASFEIGQAPTAGGAPTVLATSGTPYAGIAADAANVYFTRNDGAVGSVPVGGGAATIFLAGEAAPSAIVADGARIYFITATEIVSVAKNGSDRRVLVPASSLPKGAPADLAISNGALYLLHGDPTRKMFGSSVVRIPLATERATVVTNVPPAPAFAVDVAKDRIVVASQTDDRVSFFGRISSDNDFNPGSLSSYETLLPGQQSVTSMAVDRAYIHYTSLGSVLRFYAP